MNAIHEELNVIFKEMSIDYIQFPPQAKLGVEMGMDSQELVEFRLAVEERFKIPFSKCFFQRETSMEDVYQFIENEQKALQTIIKDNFSGSCERDINIHCDRQKAYDAIYYFDQWPKYLPHVKKISALYNDGIYQEFLMHVDSGNGEIDVRSVRKCDGNHFIIRFFQPKPPIYLLHHCGGWHFEKLSDHTCHVKTWHQWNENHEEAVKWFGIEDVLVYKKKIEKILSEHAELALKRWKENLETVCGFISA